jgi:hypothetical protein
MIMSIVMAMVVVVVMSMGVPMMRVARGGVV